MKKAGLRVLFTPFAITQYLTICIVGTALWLAYEPWRWGRVKEAIFQRYQAVPTIDGGQLERWFARKDEEQPLLFDVRGVEEFATSHLPGARRASAVATTAELGIEGKFSAPLVFYCAVGEDSAPVAQSFINRGFKRVQLLDGGIFRWANDGRALEGEAPGKVKPGKSRHAGLLDRARRIP